MRVKSPPLALVALILLLSPACTPTPPPPSATPPYTELERTDLAIFCNELNGYLANSEAFAETWNSWNTNPKANPDRAYNEARDFHDWAVELDNEVTALKRVRAAREIHDLLIDAAAKRLDSILELAEHYRTGSMENYKRYSKLYQEAVDSKNHALDAWEDLAREYNLDPSKCDTSLVTPLPTGTQRATSTASPRFTPTRPWPTATKPPCTPALDVGIWDVGRTMCVYGKVLRAGWDTDGVYYVSFSNQRGAFYILSYDWGYPDITRGACVKFIDKIERLGSSPVMVIQYGQGDRLWNCG